MYNRLVTALRVLLVKKVVVVETYPDDASGMPVMTMWSSMENPHETIKLLRELTERYERTIREQIVRKFED